MSKTRRPKGSTASLGASARPKPQETSVKDTAPKAWNGMSFSRQTVTRSLAMRR